MPSNTQLANSLRQLERRAGMAHEEGGAELATMAYPLRLALEELVEMRRFFDRINALTYGNSGDCVDAMQGVVDACEKLTSTLILKPKTRKPFDQLQREYEAMKGEIGADVRYEHARTGAHYIVLGFTWLTAVEVWGVTYAQAGIPDPVPFTCEWDVFKAKFRKVPRG